MIYIPSSLTGRLACAEVGLVVLIAQVALWMATESIRFADPARTMWPPFLVELSLSVLSLRAMLIMAAIVGIYFALRRSRRNRLAFWAFTAFAVGAQIPDLWAHNRIDWHRFFDRVAYFSEPLPLLASAALFLLTLAGLVALHRITQLRSLADDMDMRGVEAAERNAIITNEAISIAATIFVSLGLATLVVIVAMIVGRAELVSGLAGWAVVIIGAAATLSLATFLLFLYRGLSGGETVFPDEDDAGDAEA